MTSVGRVAFVDKEGKCLLLVKITRRPEDGGISVQAIRPDGNGGPPYSYPIRYGEEVLVDLIHSFISLRLSAPVYLDVNKIFVNENEIIEVGRSSS